MNKCDCGGHKANTTHSDWCTSLTPVPEAVEAVQIKKVSLFNHVSMVSGMVLVNHPNGSIGWGPPPTALDDDDA